MSSSSLLILTSLDQLLQILHLSYSSLPSPSSPSSSYQSLLPPSLSLFLLQSFNPDLASLSTNINSLSQLFKQPLSSSSTSTFSLSARKIRPGDLNYQLSSQLLSSQQSSFSHSPAFERSLELLSTITTKEPTLFHLFEGFITFFLEEQGQLVITPAFCNTIIQQQYETLQKNIEGMYDAVKQESVIHAVDRGSNVNTSLTKEPETIRLQSIVECVVTTAALRELQTVVVNDLVNAFNVCKIESRKEIRLFYIIELKRFANEAILKLMVQKQSYTIIRDRVHSTISHMFEEARKIRNLLLIQEQHSATEIARAVDLHNQNLSISSYCKLLSTLFTEIPKLGMFFDMLSNSL